MLYSIVAPDPAIYPFPNETLQHIASFLASPLLHDASKHNLGTTADFTAWKRARRDLAALQLTSKLMHAICTPLLWRTTWFDGEDDPEEKALFRLYEAQHVHHCVEEVLWKLGFNCSDTSSYVLEMLPNLRTLVLATVARGDDWSIPSGITSALVNFTNLTFLDVGNFFEFEDEAFNVNVKTFPRIQTFAVGEWWTNALNGFAELPLTRILCKSAFMGGPEPTYWVRALPPSVTSLSIGNAHGEYEFDQLVLIGVTSAFRLLVRKRTP